MSVYIHIYVYTYVCTHDRAPALPQRAVINLLLADVLSNIHSFIIISTNHAGDDMYQFDHSVTPKSGSFYMRQVTAQRRRG